MAVWFTSDTHFGHFNSIKYCNRPWVSVEEMDEALIQRWNSVVKPNDTIYHLGDFFFCDVNRAIEILKQLNGKIHWVPGNHDSVLLKNFKTFDEYLVQLQPISEFKLNKQHAVLSHYPLFRWNRGHYGAFMLHGHCHGTIQDHNIGLRRYDVGVDCNNWYPISWDAIYEKLSIIEINKDFEE